MSTWKHDKNVQYLYNTLVCNSIINFVTPNWWKKIPRSTANPFQNKKTLKDLRFDNILDDKPQIGTPTCQNLSAIIWKTKISHQTNFFSSAPFVLQHVHEIKRLGIGPLGISINNYDCFWRPLHFEGKSLIKKKKENLK